MQVNEEVVFLHNEDITVTDKSVQFWTTTIVTSSICSVRYGKRKVKPPYVVFGLATLLGILAVLSVDFAEFLFPIVLILFLFGCALWFQKEQRNDNAIIISLLSGKEFFIYENQVDELETVYKALVEMVNYRG